MYVTSDVMKKIKPPKIGGFMAESYEMDLYFGYKKFATH